MLSEGSQRNKYCKISLIRRLLKNKQTNPSSLIEQITVARGEEGVGMDEVSQQVQTPVIK